MEYQSENSIKGMFLEHLNNIYKEDSAFKKQKLASRVGLGDSGSKECLKHGN
jgi:hypothetical protein